MQGVSGLIIQIDRDIKGVLRTVSLDTLPQATLKNIRLVRLACNEVRLDVRDYEFAQARKDQLTAGKLARHNLRVLERYVLALDEIFGPADIASIGAKIDLLREKLT